MTIVGNRRLHQSTIELVACDTHEKQEQSKPNVKYSRNPSGDVGIFVVAPSQPSGPPHRFELFVENTCGDTNQAQHDFENLPEPHLAEYPNSIMAPQSLVDVIRRLH